MVSLLERREKFKTYVSLTINECIKIGYDSLFIVSIVSIFMGAVTTIQTAFNLVGPLIPDYVISLVVRDMTLLELSPTIIAIVFAGKVGSNIAGELGTMRITEQIDALEVMGINSRAPSSSFINSPGINVPTLFTKTSTFSVLEFTKSMNLSHPLFFERSEFIELKLILGYNSFISSPIN